MTLTGGIDGNVTVSLFDRSKFTVYKVITEVLQLHQLYRLSYLKAQGMERSPYRGSGEWGAYISKEGPRALHINVDVGCSHEHDCCGCLCSLSYTIEVCSKVIVVTTYRGYNV